MIFRPFMFNVITDMVRLEALLLLFPLCSICFLLPFLTCSGIIYRDSIPSALLALTLCSLRGCSSNCDRDLELFTVHLQVISHHFLSSVRTLHSVLPSLPFWPWAPPLCQDLASLTRQSADILNSLGSLHFVA